MEDKKVRLYDSINVKPQTKQRVDSLYYAAKMKKKYRSFDEWINEILDFVEKNK